MKSGSHLLNNIKQLFRHAMLQRMKSTKISCGEGRRTSKLKVEKNSSAFNLLCPNERCISGVKARKFSLSCGSGNNICQQNESICVNQYKGLL